MFLVAAFSPSVPEASRLTEAGVSQFCSDEPAPPGLRVAKPSERDVLSPRPCPCICEMLRIGPVLTENELRLQERSETCENERMPKKFVGDLRDHIRENSIPEPNTGCWIWLKRTNRNGYGQFGLRGFGNRSEEAHRVSWKVFTGKAPAAGNHLDHICRQRSCVNPDHLREVTPRENLVANGSLSKVKLYGERTECHVCGGDLVTFLRPSRKYPIRVCRTCRSRKAREAKARGTRC